jgi:hypothetical protein
MNPQGTSFIPQRPIASQSTKKVVRKVYVLTYLSYILFFGTVLSAVGIFAYGKVIDSQLATQKERLVQAEKQFDASQISEVRALDNKIKIAQQRMDLHLSVLLFFEALEQNVSQKLFLKTFSFLRENDAAPVIELTGEADVLNSLVFQREVLKSNPLLAGSEFSEVVLASAPLEGSEGDIQKNQAVTISFWLKKTVAIDLLQYKPRLVFDENALSESTLGTEGTEEVEENDSVSKVVEESIEL